MIASQSFSPLLRRFLPLFYLCNLAVAMSSCSLNTNHPIVSTYSGNGKMAFANGRLLEASFANPMGIAADSSGNLYIADSHNNLIRKVSTAGQVSVMAGSGKEGHEDGLGIAASFFYPESLCLDKEGNIYVSDTHNNLIRKITPAGMVSTLAGNLLDSSASNKVAQGSRLDNPIGITIDGYGNLFVADYENDVIRKISRDGIMTVFAGKMGSPGNADGKGTQASFYLPWGIVADSANNLYVTDCYNNMIRKISPDGVVSTLAGKKDKGYKNGPGTLASFLHPAGISIDALGNLYVADIGNQRIRKITPGGMVSTYAGNGKRGWIDKPDTLASFNKPYGLSMDREGNLFVADYLNNVIRKISPGQE